MQVTHVKEAAMYPPDVELMLLNDRLEEARRRQAARPPRRPVVRRLVGRVLVAAGKRLLREEPGPAVGRG
jgi:hypothetical protein